MTANRSASAGHAPPALFSHPTWASARKDMVGASLGSSRLWFTVAEGIVHQHGGTIAASNRAEGGACLEVTLPASGSRRQEASA